MNTTLDQWEVLEAVVKAGSFAAAAARMHRSQSTISYAISRLQEQFNNPLLEMKGRRAHLTEAGKTLLAQAEPLLAGFRTLEQDAASSGPGTKTRLNVSADSLFPSERLFSALSKLTRLYPGVHPQVHRTPFITSAREFTDFGADLCITCLPAGEQFVKPIVDIRIRAVARVDHPLRTVNRELTRLDLIQHLAVIIENDSGPEPRRQPHSESQPHVVVNTIDSAIQAVRSGICFGWLPVYRIASYLNSGELVGLPLPLGGERSVRMFLVLKDVDSTSSEKNVLLGLLGANHELEVL
jgi:DNA-binding transcriptional LysR family regulator